MMLFYGSLIMNAVFCFGAVSFTYDSGFINDVADPVVGGLYITFLACFINAGQIIPSTISTFVIKYMNYHVFQIGCLTLAAITMPFSFWYAKKVDAVDIMEFRIYTEEFQQESKKDKSCLDVSESKTADEDVETNQAPIS